MASSWMVTTSYLAYAVGLLCMAASWFAFLAVWVVYRQIDAGNLEESWRATGHLVARSSWLALWLSAVSILSGFAAALPGGVEAGSLGQTHRSFLLRLAPIAALCFGLVFLAEGRMGSLDADLLSVAALLWCFWLLAAGWRAFCTDVTVAGPLGWQVALAVSLAVGGFCVWFFCCFRMTRLF
ncbi:hypothetical protein HBA54_20290 [Pelagibius litoralis]|uniref:Uncharacterized protein n=1 Tax=Pelagibius litoralis TaxID=374515 RepID=A0A967F0Q9_9PROT|nr:hypothetical protein [Pelagibius litoralis]NIA70944.1 hypothetical protein [Pelagibius litoralis]